jgi:hypothetical protein
MYYCNPTGADPNGIAGCHERGVGCLSYGADPAYFGEMGQCVGCDPEWACVSVVPGGGYDDFGPLDADDIALPKDDLPYKGNIDKAMNTVTLSESELVKLIKKTLNKSKN